MPKEKKEQKVKPLKYKKGQVWLNLGSGIHLKKYFLNVDNSYEEFDLRKKQGICKNAIVEPGAKYLKADIHKLPFKDNYADYVEMFEVLEHMPMRDVVGVLKEIYRVMKPGAKLLLHTPNMDGLAKDWIEMFGLYTGPKFDVNKYISVAETIYGNQLAPGEFHHCPFNPTFMNWCLVQAGFKQGSLTLVPKHTQIPNIGSEKHKKGVVARNELLIAEVIK